MYGLATRRRALALHADGLPFSEVSRLTGASRSTIREWTVRIHPLPGVNTECPLTGGTLSGGIRRRKYAHLLDLCLGDGCISTTARGVYALRIACCDDWPGLKDLCADALRAVMPGSSVCRAQSVGCTQMVSYSRHWPCLFPQHGPGKKHLRAISLAPWQREIAGRNPWPLIRGLIHSDGCRITNWATRTVGGEKRRYEYPRYIFTDTSGDIMRIFTDTLDAVGVAWRSARALVGR